MSFKPNFDPTYALDSAAFIQEATAPFQGMNFDVILENGVTKAARAAFAQMQQPQPVQELPLLLQNKLFLHCGGYQITEGQLSRNFGPSQVAVHVLSVRAAGSQASMPIAASTMPALLENFWREHFAPHGYGFTEFSPEYSLQPVTSTPRPPALPVHPHAAAPVEEIVVEAEPEFMEEDSGEFAWIEDPNPNLLFGGVRPLQPFPADLMQDSPEDFRSE